MALALILFVKFSKRSFFEILQRYVDFIKHENGSDTEDDQNNAKDYHHYNNTEVSGVGNRAITIRNDNYNYKENMCCEENVEIAEQDDIQKSVQYLKSLRLFIV